MSNVEPGLGPHAVRCSGPGLSRYCGALRWGGTGARCARPRHRTTCQFTLSPAHPPLRTADQTHYPYTDLRERRRQIVEEDTRVEIEVICEHYLTRSECENFWGRLGEGPNSMWECPVCRVRCFEVNRGEGFAGCRNGACEVPEGLTPSQVVAVLGDFDPRTQKREINRERKTILNEDELARRREQEARRNRAEALEELQRHEASEALRGWEARYNLAEREAAMRALSWQAQERTPARVAERRAEAEGRTDHHLARLLYGQPKITVGEAIICALLFSASLVGIPYFLWWFASLAPSFLPPWLVAWRLHVGLVCGSSLAFASWLGRSRARRRSAGLRGGEYVGIYTLDEEGRIRWRDVTG